MFPFSIGNEGSVKRPDWHSCGSVNTNSYMPPVPPGRPLSLTTKSRGPKSLAAEFCGSRPIEAFDLETSRRTTRHRPVCPVATSVSLMCPPGVFCVRAVRVGGRADLLLRDGGLEAADREVIRRVRAGHPAGRAHGASSTSAPNSASATTTTKALRITTTPAHHETRIAPAFGEQLRELL